MTLIRFVLVIVHNPCFAASLIPRMNLYVYLEDFTAAAFSFLPLFPFCLDLSFDHSAESTCSPNRTDVADVNLLNITSS